MLKRTLLVLGAALLVTVPALAADTTVTAKNGIKVSVHSDQFADRYEYSAPSIDFKLPNGQGHGFVLVAAIKHAGKITGPLIEGYVYYEGDWRHYYRAIFKGGKKATFTNTAQKVVTCAGGDDCTLSEGFMIEPTEEQVHKYASGGTLDFQVRSQNADNFILHIPVTYLQAVRSVSHSK